MVHAQTSSWPRYTCKYPTLGCNEVSLQPSILLTKKARLLQAVVRGEVLQHSGHLCGPPLDPLQKPDIIPVLGPPGTDAVLQMDPHKSRAEGSNHLPHPTATPLLMH